MQAIGQILYLLLFIFIAWCAAGAKRLYVSWRGAIVAAVLTFAACLIVAGVAWFLLNLVVNNVVMPMEPPPVGDSMPGSSMP